MSHTQEKSELGPKDGDKEPDKPQGRMHTGEGKKKAKEIKRRGASLPGWSKSAGKGEQVVKSVTSPQAHWDPVGIIPEVHTLFCTGTLRALGPLLKALSATRAGSGFPALRQTWENLMQLNGRHRKEVRNENDAKPTIPSPLSPPSARIGKAQTIALHLSLFLFPSPACHKDSRMLPFPRCPRCVRGACYSQYYITHI